MSLTSSPEPAESLLGDSTSKLRLRIRGTRRDGQTIGLRSPKISIGSAPNCTLRLRGPGIAPLHCLILRGHDRTIVRRWAADTRLNDDAFEDAMLNVGDRLTIGPIDLDVIEAELASVLSEASPSVDAPNPTPIPAAPIPSNETDVADRQQLETQWRGRLANVNFQSRRRARSLAKQLRATRQQLDLVQQTVASHQQHADHLVGHQSQLEAVIQSLQQQLIEATARQSADERSVHQQQTELTERAQRLQIKQQSIAAAREALEDQQATITQDRRALDSEREKLKQQHEKLSQQSESLDQQRQALDEQQQQLARDRAQHQSTDQQRQRALEERESELRRRAHELDAQSHDLMRREQELAKSQADRQSIDRAAAAESSQAHLAEQIEQLAADRKQLADRETELSRQRQQFQQDSHQLTAQRQEFNCKSAELAAERNQLEQDSKQLEQGAKQLEAAQQKLKAERQKLAADQQQVQLDQDRLNSDRAQFQAKLQQESTALEQLHHEQSARETHWNDQRAQQETSLAKQAQLLDERTAQLEHQELEFTRQQAQLEHDRQAPGQQAVSEREPAASEPSPEIAKLADHEPSAVDLVSAPSPTAEPGSATELTHEEIKLKTDEDDVFARLRALALLKDTPGKSQSTDDNRADEPLAPSAAVKTNSPAPTGAPEEDVSIDDYMVKLLERMRGPGGADVPLLSARTIQKSVDERPPITKPTSPELQPAFTSESRETASKQRGQLEPRKVAPENTRDLAAMREIANQSARSAIAMHHHRSRSNRAWATLAVGAICLACGVLLICWTPDISEPMFYVGVVGLLVAVGCFGRSAFSARLARIWKHRRQLHLSPQPSSEILDNSREPLAVESSAVTPPASDTLETPATEPRAI